jgi:hypothetical protein
MRIMNVAYSRVLGIESEGEVFAGYLKGGYFFTYIDLGRLFLVMVFRNQARL